MSGVRAALECRRDTEPASFVSNEPAAVARAVTCGLNLSGGRDEREGRRVQPRLLELRPRAPPFATLTTVLPLFGHTAPGRAAAWKD